jgi:hypothetical protein
VSPAETAWRRPYCHAAQMLLQLQTQHCWRLRHPQQRTGLQNPWPHLHPLLLGGGVRDVLGGPLDGVLDAVEAVLRGAHHAEVALAK